MKTTSRRHNKAVAITFCFFLLIAFAIRPAVAQLAITEVMSSAATNFGVNLVIQGPDYFEVSNFGTNDIDLTGVRFRDSQSGISGADPGPFIGLTIKGGESIVFFESRSNWISPDAFRAWWGLGTNIQVVPYTNDGFGFSAQSPGDGVRLWGPTATNNLDVIDSVDFGPATRGRSFTYDSVTGEWGVLSTLGVEGAFQAATADDIGSPGTNPGPVAITVVEQPTPKLANPGDAITFAVAYRGLPRPTFQWFHNGAPIPGARLLSYTLASAQMADGGSYYVVLSNVFQVVTSATATLTVSTNPVAPEFLQPPTDLWTFVDQTATFQSVATGLPQPAYQWRLNGVNIVGATNRTLVIAAPRPVGTNIYSVVASNASGAVTNDVQLLTTMRPDLHITEIMPSENIAPGLNHQDWWELTNFGTNAVDLFGYRFDDFSAVLGAGSRPRLSFAWTNRNHVIIRPGESIVFVESMSPDEFRRWWSAANLPPDLQIITYSGANLGLSGNSADGLGLWNMGATADNDFVNPEFSVASYSPPIVRGASLTTNPDTDNPGDMDCCYLLSDAGTNGAFVAAESGDIGSPGYIRTPREPRVFSVVREPGGWCLTWRSMVAGSYVVQYRDDLFAGDWEELVTLPPAGPTTSFLDTSADTSNQRYYRVVLLPAP